MVASAALVGGAWAAQGSATEDKNLGLREACITLLKSFP